MNVEAKLEQAMADYFWAPEDVTVVERPGLGYVHSPRDEVLFNCVFRSRPALEAPRAMVAEVVAAHAGRSSRWTVNGLSHSEALIEALADAGYERGDQHYGYAIHVDAYDRVPRSAVRVERVTTLRHLQDLYGIVHDVFGRETPRTDEEVARELDECTRADGRVARFVAYLDGEPIGSGGITGHFDIGFGFIWAGGIVAAQRGQGAYTALVRARIEWARQRGIEHVGVYAKLATSAPILAAHGFERHGFVDYWERSP